MADPFGETANSTEPFDETVLDILFNAMFERNIDQDVINALRERQDSICVDYRPDDPNDIAIVNNKIERVTELASSAERGDGDIDDALLTSMLQVLRTKY